VWVDKKATQKRFQFADALGVEPNGRFIGDQELGLVDECGGKHRSLPHPVRIPFGEVVDEVVEVEELDHFRHFFPCPSGRHSVQVRGELEELATSEFFVQEWLVRNVADDCAGLVSLGLEVKPADTDRSTCGEQEPAEHLDGGRLSGPIRA
jgi:hypothetical protein